MVDALCQMHDLMYTIQGEGELGDDNLFVNALTDWARTFKAYESDGWTGTTFFETTVVIPWILEIFSLKNAVA